MAQDIETLKRNLKIVSKENKTLTKALAIVEDEYADSLVGLYDAVAAVVPALTKNKNLAANVEIARKRGLALQVLKKLHEEELEKNGRKPSKK